MSLPDRQLVHFYDPDYERLRRRFDVGESPRRRITVEMPSRIEVVIDRVFDAWEIRISARVRCVETGRDVPLELREQCRREPTQGDIADALGKYLLHETEEQLGMEPHKRGRGF